jgi:hypothetical protein
VLGALQLLADAGPEVHDAAAAASRSRFSGSSTAPPPVAMTTSWSCVRESITFALALPEAGFALLLEDVGNVDAVRRSISTSLS